MQTSTAACEEAAKASTTKFTEEFRKHAPSYLNDPSYTTTFHKATSDVEAPTEVPAALKVKFVLPHVRPPVPNHVLGSYRMTPCFMIHFTRILYT